MFPILVFSILFGYCNIHCHSVLRTFRQMDFYHRNISKWGIFGTGNFLHDGHFSRHFGTCATVPKCQCAKMFLCQNAPVPKNPLAEKSLCQKVPILKCSHVEMSICRNVCSPEWWTCQNVPVIKHPCRNDSCRNVPCRNGL